MKYTMSHKEMLPKKADFGISYDVWMFHEGIPQELPQRHAKPQNLITVLQIEANRSTNVK